MGLHISEERLSSVLEKTDDLRDTPRVGSLVRATRQEMIQEAWETPSEELASRYWDEQDWENTWLLRLRRIVAAA